jgi:hypothetical protein
MIIVTATASSQRVRYIAAGEVHQTRLQVFSVDGSQVYDSTFRLGNLIDWQLRDQQGAQLADSSYLFLVTVRDFSNNLTQKYGTAQIEQEQVALQQISRDELPSPQSTALAANQLSEGLSPVDRIGAAGINRTATTSPTGQTTTGTEPAGTSTAEATTVTGENATGTGTQNRIAKWTDNAGTLGDSTITENSDGKIGVGADPVGSIKLNIFSSFGTIPFGFTQNAPASAFPTLALFSTSDGAVGQYAATTHNGAVTFLMGATSGRNFGLFANNSYNAPNLFIKNDGNVGIGTTTPTSGKLHVVSTGGPAIYGTSATRGVWGVSTGGSYGVYGESVNGIGMQGVSTANIGVVGSTSAASNNIPGVYGVSGGNNGVGILGEANTGNAFGVYGRSTSASSTSIGVYGGSTNGMGVRGDSTGSIGYGVFAQNTSSGGMALGVGGNATQYRENGGLIKAMVSVNANGVIVRCYNSQLIGNAASTGAPLATTAPCGFSVTNPGGTYVVDFGFKVNDRFYSLTLVNNNTGYSSAVRNSNYVSSLLDTQLDVIVSERDYLYAIPFMLIVY